MCEIVEKIREEGREEGRNEERIIKITEMLNNGKTPQAIADFCNYPIKLIQEIQNSLLITQ